jgi:hypothetical protein
MERRGRRSNAREIRRSNAREPRRNDAREPRRNDARELVSVFTEHMHHGVGPNKCAYGK